MGVRIMSKKYNGYCCPICNNPSPSMKEYYDSDIHMVVEEYIDCETCGYSYEFAYGHSRESFEKYDFYWSHSTKFNDVMFKRKSKKMFMARRNWKKGLRKYERNKEA